MYDQSTDAVSGSGKSGTVSDTAGVPEPLLLITMNPPKPGQIVNVDGLRYRVLRILRWTGTVARLEIERVADDDA